jgi:hypothetical protein
MRYIGLDVHREFTQLAVLEDGPLRKRRQDQVTPQALRAWADRKPLVSVSGRCDASREERPEQVRERAAVAMAASSNGVSNFHGVARIPMPALGRRPGSSLAPEIRPERDESCVDEPVAREVDDPGQPSRSAA